MWNSKFSSPKTHQGTARMNRLLSKFDSESLQFLSNLEQSAWGFQEKLKTSAASTTTKTKTSTTIKPPPWSEGMLDVFESFSFVCGPHPRPQSTIKTVEHLTQWLGNMLADVAVKRDQYRLRLLRQGHAPLRTLRDENTHTSSTLVTSNTTSTAASNARKKSEILEREERREEHKCRLVEDAARHIFAQSVCHVLGGRGIGHVKKEEEKRVMLHHYSVACVHPSVSSLIHTAVELHSESSVVVQGSLAAASPSPYQLKTWSMILGFISRGSMPLILHHVLDNYEALGGEFVVLFGCCCCWWCCCCCCC